MSAPAPVRLHPETTDDPQTLRWVTDTTALTEPTPAMTGLVDDGTLAELRIAPGEIRTRLAAGRSWTREGERVRSVLFRALSALAEAPGGNETLSDRIAEVLRRDVAPFVNSHGGDIRVVSLEDGTLTVGLGGACGQCTLRSTTLRNVVADAVRSRFPEVRRVRAVPR